MNWRELIKWSSGDGAALTNTSTATSLLLAASKTTLPPDYFKFVGQRFRVRAAGRISTVITTPGTMTLDIRFGSTVVINSGDMTLNIVAKTNVGWILEWDAEVRVLGGTANLLSQGWWSSEAVIGSAVPTAGGVGTHMLPYNTAPVVGSNFDSQASQVVDLFGKWSVANAANSITLHSFQLEALTSGI
jgi:hypothetical protein